METTVTTQQEIRYVPDTFGRYRYLNQDELVAGVTTLMVDIDRVGDRLNDARFVGTEITIDEDPLFNNHGTPSVYFHNTRPRADIQCFSPVERFTTGHHERDDFPHPGPRHEFWVPTS